MWVNDRNYRLSKHGRKRFLERIGPTCLTDKEIILRAIDMPEAKWKPEQNMTSDLRLVTVYPREV